MNWNQNKSILLSQVCVILFGAILLAIDIGAYWLVTLFLHWRGMSAPMGPCFLVTVYVCSVFAWLLLWKLWTLLRNIRREQVFVAENVRALRTVSWCCVGAFLVCLLSACYYLPFLAVSIAAGFMALIVRIVKNVFSQAIDMKSELDFTV